MNMKYEIKKGKIFVTDENGAFTEHNYQDNIDEILAKENVIENINDEKKKLVNKVANLNDKIKLRKKRKSEFYALLTLIFIIAGILSSPLVASKITIIFIITLLTSEIIDKNKKSNINNEIKDAMKLQLELSDLIKLESEKLEELKLVRTRDLEKYVQDDSLFQHHNKNEISKSNQVVNDLKLVRTRKKM